ncbi:hypothetical protein HMPREF0731_1827, partial [Pseudoroseomonas cervicalis ATCC 49957]
MPFLRRRGSSAAPAPYGRLEGKRPRPPRVSWCAGRAGVETAGAARPRCRAEAGGA